MTPQEIREALRSDSPVREQAFPIVKAISTLISDERTFNLGQELLLRALDRRDKFTGIEMVLDALVRSAGLYPYLPKEKLSIADSIAYEYHRPRNMEESFVFHREQAYIYRRLLSGDSIILSAPTSFGKSRVIDAVIASGSRKNIVLVVPTLALIDETRRRLSIYSDRFKIVTHTSQQAGNSNIFIFTAERTVAYKSFPPIDFFAIDEFYKLDSGEDESTRAVALNQAFYRLRKISRQFYLLGPNIQSIPDGLEKAFKCQFYPTKFSTVATEQIRVGGRGSDMERLLKLCRTLDEPTLIFCRSPKRVNEVAHALLQAGIGRTSSELSPAARWAAREYHPDWIYGRALVSGVGIHHGRLPRALSQYVVRCFNESKLNFLVCTSTLIEGVNTKAKNVIIFDNKIAKSNIDFFTFNNIRGRSGRMFQHFVGHVYLFNDPPTEALPFVDFPLFTQNESAADSLLIQIDRPDLLPAAKARMDRYSGQALLPLEILKLNSSIDPSFQLELAEHIRSHASSMSRMLAWTAFPTSANLQQACDLIWTYFLRGSSRKGGVFSAKQLAFKIWQLFNTPSAAKRIEAELNGGKYAAASADEAVERVLEFERTWAAFEMPRFLMALSSIQRHVLSSIKLPCGDYSSFSVQLENFFHPPVLVALDEYGIPLQVAEKIRRHLPIDSDLDATLLALRSINTTRLSLDAFERELVDDARANL